MENKHLAKLVSCLYRAQEQPQTTFISLFSQMLTLIKSATFEQSFSELATTSERFKFVLSHEAVTRMILDLISSEHNPQVDKKSANKAAEFGKNGNRTFQARRYEDALESYSSAIRYAPQDDALLPIAFGSRSGAFFLLKQYEAALKDIEAAQSHPQYKPFFMLTIRKCQCLLRLKRGAKVREILDAIKRDDLNKSDVALLDKFYQREGENLKNGKEEDEVESKKKEIEPELLKNLLSVIKILSEKGRFVPQSSNSSLSSKVEVRYDEKNGRHLVTTQNVNFGDILAVTKPYAAVLTEEQELLLCHHCLTSLKPISGIFQRSVPCTDCTRVLYCSEHCRTESWQEYHRFECPLLGNIEMPIGDEIIDRLALRTLFVAGGLESIRAITQKFLTTGDPVKSADFTDNPVDYYENVYRMEMKMEDGDIKLFILAFFKATFLFIRSKYGEDADILDATASQNSAALEKDDIFGIETLLRHYLQVLSNKSIFVRSDQSELYTETARTKFIFTFDPLISLVRQSCDPNISINVIDCAKSVQVTNVCAFFAIKPIPAGTVLSMNVPFYGDYHVFLTDLALMRKGLPPQLLRPCEHCEAKQRDNPLGSITTGGTDGHEFVCCGDAACDGFIRRTDNDRVICCTCKREIGTDELAELKKTLSDISELHSQANLLIAAIETLVVNDNKNANFQNEFCSQLVRLETLINDRIAPLALKHSRLLLVDLYKQLNSFYRFCHFNMEPNNNKFVHLLKAWKYAQASHTTLERHFGGDSLGLQHLIMKNLFFFSKAIDFVQSALDDPIGLFPCLSLDDDREESRNMLVRFVDSYNDADNRVRHMDDYYKMV